MHSIHTIIDYQTTSSRTSPVLSGFPSLDNAHDIIYHPVRPNETRRGCFVQTAEDRHHSPIPEGPNRMTCIALSAVAAGVSSAANTYSQAVIYREISAHSKTSQSTVASPKRPENGVEPSHSTFDNAPNDQHSTMMEPNDIDRSVSAPTNSIPDSNPDQKVETLQGEAQSLESDIPSTLTSQNQEYAVNMDASSQHVDQQSQTHTSTESKIPDSGAHQKTIYQGDLEVRIRSRGADIGSGATEYSSSYDQQQQYPRDLGVRFFNQGRESSFMPIGSAQSLLELEPGAKNHKIWFSSAVTGQCLAVDIQKLRDNPRRLSDGIECAARIIQVPKAYEDSLERISDLPTDLFLFGALDEPSTRIHIRGRRIIDKLFEGWFASSALP
ncbi:hypothetical protein FHETE_7170 [Fusarium heterosporum]|uniref:Uncharacterized protein n=1 Tax=Fusarium heterosporum TaxID=42747 RepID=A0A8H5T6Z7_FUSHE|nr:hypothetical protein FHETE_7170 [Fusarium heterosporum]